MVLSSHIEKLASEMKLKENKEKEWALELYIKIHQTLASIPEDKLSFVLDLYFNELHKERLNISDSFDLRNWSEQNIKYSFRDFATKDSKNKLEALANSMLFVGINRSVESNPWAIGFYGGTFCRVEYQGKELYPFWGKPLATI
jgi:hypothetical protein